MSYHLHSAKAASLLPDMPQPKRNETHRRLSDPGLVVRGSPLREAVWLRLSPPSTWAPREPTPARDNASLCLRVGLVTVSADPQAVHSPFGNLILCCPHTLWQP